MLSTFEAWSPWLHVFVLFYAGTIFFLLALLHPELIGDGHNTMEYFLENRKMFFGTLIVLALIDIADTSIKSHLGLSAPPTFLYSVFMVLWIVISGFALFTRKPKLHAVYAPVFLIVLIVWVSYVIPGILEIVSGAA